MLKTLLAILLLPGSCIFSNSIEQHGDPIKFQRFPSEQKVQLQKLYPIPNTFGFTIFELDNRLYFNSLEAGSKLMYVYDIEKNSITDSVFSRGTSRHQGILPLSVGLLPGRILWFYDPMLSKVVWQGVQAEANDVSKLPMRQYSVSNQFKYLQLIDTSSAYAVRVIDMKSKISKIDLKTGTETPLFGKFNGKPSHLSEGAWQLANSGSLFYSPTHQKAILAKSNFDEIEIFDCKRETSIVVKGPEQISPKFQQISTPEGEFVDLTPNIRRTYLMSGQLTDEHIYLLYSNAYEMTEGNDFGNTIHVFSYAGKPVKKITLSEKVSTFYVSEATNTVYALCPELGSIAKAAL